MKNATILAINEDYREECQPTKEHLRGMLDNIERNMGYGEIYNIRLYAKIDGIPGRSTTVTLRRRTANQPLFPMVSAAMLMRQLEL